MKRIYRTALRFLLTIPLLTLIGCSSANQVKQPIVSTNSLANCVLWDAVENANSYAVYVDGVLTETTTGQQYCLNTNNYGQPHVIQVEAIHYDENQKSPLSTPIAIVSPPLEITEPSFVNNQFYFETNEFGDVSVQFQPHISGLIDLVLSYPGFEKTTFPLPELIRVSDGALLLGVLQEDGVYRYSLADEETYAFTVSLIDNPDYPLMLELMTAMRTDLSEPYSFTVDETTTYVEVFVELSNDGPLIVQIDGQIHCMASMMNGLDWMSTNHIEPGVIAIGYQKTEAEAGLVLRFIYDTSRGEGTITLTRIQPQTIIVNQPITFTINDEWKIYRIDALTSMGLVELILSSNHLEVEATLYYSSMFERNWNSIEIEGENIIRSVLQLSEEQAFYLIIRSKKSVSGTFEVRITWE
jgi:hypothetical protein